MTEERKIEAVKDFVDYIDEFIKLKGISRRELEKSVFISAGIISRWKKGAYSPNLEILLEILKYLNVEMILRFNPYDLNNQKVVLDLEVENTIEIINYIDGLIKLKGISRKILEESVCISKGIISRWKKKEIQPRLETILAILKYLNVEMIFHFNPYDLNNQSTVLDLKQLEQMMLENLYLTLECDISKLVSKVLFSNDITLGDKKQISKTLSYLIKLNELKRSCME